MKNNEQELKDAEAFSAVGYYDHVTTFKIMLAFGAILGIFAGIQDISGADSGSVFEILKEATALTVFSLLTLSGLYGYIFVEILKALKKSTDLIEKVLGAARALLKNGLSCGFIASGTTIGLGCSCLAVFALAGHGDLIDGPRMLIVVGLIIHAVTWLLMFQALLVEGSQSLFILGVGGTFAVVVVVVTSYYRPQFLLLLGIVFAIYIAAEIYRRMAKRKKKEANEVDAQQIAAADV